MSNKQKRNLIFLIAAAALVFWGCGWLIYRFYPTIIKLLQPENMAIFQKKLQAFGLLGAIFLFGLQILQVISAVIPALPIQIGAGVTYGALGGLAICISGVLAGNALVFIVVRRFGQPVIDRMFPKEKQKQLAFLQDTDQLSLIVFILYLIPAMPKDVLNYLAGLTPLTLKRYLAITLIARTPTILGNTFASSALLNGNHTTATIVFCITSTLGILCMLFSKKILQYLKKLKK
ncbi:VTT domain-containing protein [Oscillospiraceae bacterium PP1C4]